LKKELGAEAQLASVPKDLLEENDGAAIRSGHGQAGVLIGTAVVVRPR